MHKSNRGFSLLEVLVAFVILAMVLGVLMQIFSGGLRNAGVASEYQQAVLLGQSKLASIGIETPLEASEASGEFDSTYRWQVSIRPYQDSQMQESEQAVQPAPIMPVRLLEVDVRVQWGESEQPRSVDFKTLRLANQVTL
jgi:general secretion pathway protein I